LAFARAAAEEFGVGHSCTVAFDKELAKQDVGGETSGGETTEGTPGPRRGRSRR
jgi:hypothetical protein